MNDMNERINQLLKQARNFTAENHVPGGSDYEREIYVTFAELIVQELTSKCVGENQYKLGFQLAKEFKEHFGVEE